MLGATASRPMAKTTMMPITASSVIPLSDLRSLAVTIIVHVFLLFLLLLLEFPLLVRVVLLNIVRNARDRLLARNKAGRICRNAGLRPESASRRHTAGQDTL